MNKAKLRQTLLFFFFSFNSNSMTTSLSICISLIWQNVNKLILNIQGWATSGFYLNSGFFLGGGVGKYCVFFSNSRLKSSLQVFFLSLCPSLNITLRFKDSMIFAHTHTNGSLNIIVNIITRSALIIIFLN